MNAIQSRQQGVYSSMAKRFPAAGASPLGRADRWTQGCIYRQPLADLAGQDCGDFSHNTQQCKLPDRAAVLQAGKLTAQDKSEVFAQEKAELTGRKIMAQLFPGDTCDGRKDAFIIS
jgi:hypothetical protein